MSHERTEGHEVYGTTAPHDGMALTETITAGSIPGIGEFALGRIMGNPQGNLMLSVLFKDGEQIIEELDMGTMLSGWISEIAHSKRMRDEFPVVDGKMVQP